MRLLVLGLLFLLSLSLVNALSCDYDSQPVLYLTSSPSAYCYSTTLNDTDCFTYLSYGGDIFNVMPKETYVDNYGLLSSYKMRNGHVSVEFGRANLHTNALVNATVVCGDENITFNFTPTLLDYDEFIDTTVKVRKNSQDYLFYFFMAIILIIIITMLWRVAK